MYNYSLKLTYRDVDSDTTYRKELLEVFDIKKYNAEINNRIDTLHAKHGEFFKDIVECIKKNDKLSIVRDLDDKTCFMILFSWEYFYETHEILGLINTNVDFAVKKQILLDKILSQKK
jgi:uncharacterized coiled-coil DUF342 family protein